MVGVSREELRVKFEEVPELYERARPTYPEAVFDDIVELAGLKRGDRVLEIGPGTGKATRPLAERGLRVVGVELGEGLARVASERLAGFDNVEIVNATFETWEPAVGDFAAVIAFTAFHWVDPEVRYLKSARLLRRGGALAVVDARHVLTEGSDRFWIDVQEDYDAVVPSDENRPPPPPEEVPSFEPEIDASGCFGAVTVRRYLWDVTYTADDYLAVLDTYSGHRSIAEAQRFELYERIRRRIEGRTDPRVRKSYVSVLDAARKR
jgi:SAM-dependent methyltransferase